MKRIPLLLFFTIALFANVKASHNRAGEITYKDFFEKIAPKFHKKAPKTLLPKLLTSFVWRLEVIRSFFTGKAPLITKETALSSSHSFKYSNDKIKQLLNFEFNNLDTSLERVCGNLLKKYT